MIIYSIEGIYYNNNKGDKDITNRLSQYFMDGIYISDAIFLPIFIILFTQMILFNEYGHMTKGL